MQTFMANLSELLDGLFKADLETIMTERVDLDAEVSESVKSTISYAQTVAEAKLCHTTFEVFDMMGEAETSVQFRACYDKGATFELDVKSAELGKGLSLALALAWYRQHTLPYYNWLISQ